MSNLIFEMSAAGRSIDILPGLDVDPVAIPSEMQRKSPLNLPAVSENDLARHYTALATKTYGVNNGFYPLGSCTMKYNPKIDEETAALPGFAAIHPLQPEATAQGCLEVIHKTEQYLCEITGMDAMSFTPAAGAHGEFAGLLLIKAYHQSRGDTQRTKIIVPDSAHGTNPASAAMANMTIISVPSKADGCVDLEKLRAAAGADTAGLMLTNPNTLGIFEKDILEITKIIHDAGGLNYYDGANLNAVMGIVRPGDMGFDVIHLNLHKTFATPHGGGGPGSGPVGCKNILAPFLPKYHVTKTETGYTFSTPEKSIGSMKAFYGNFAVVVKALTYILSLGSEGIVETSTHAVLNANYMKALLADVYDMASDGICMHEFIITLEKVKKQHGISAMDIAKGLLDYKMHPPTMYFPLIIPEALMVEPTETESRESIDATAAIYRKVLTDAIANPDGAHASPITTPIGRVDEVGAARNPRLRYVFE
jgi:glycine dehydrogenase subunit 2